MFSSLKRETRTKARKIVIRSGILNNYPGMQVGEWASAPHIVFVHNGRAYGLVPAHALLPGPIHPDVGALSDEGVEDLEGFTFGDFGEDSDGDQVLDHEAVSTGLGSLSPRTEYPASEDELFKAYHGMIPESTAHDGNPMFGESHHNDRDRKINKDGDPESLLDTCLVASIDLDYALLELEFDPLLSLADIVILDISPQKSFLALWIKNEKDAGRAPTKVKAFDFASYILEARKDLTGPKNIINLNENGVQEGESSTGKVLGNVLRKGAEIKKSESTA
ncbi:hypothetical protein DL766_006397 [Monosporascus sp. MC13-8B]|uniref:Uncharacterized protein n=1 Tax=Monosporascus cannonballus TaxID=155416 RepID=A0ABY0H337_9PEZI|nr:hypothetical protein DL762_006195 [Monosporascus cannonballus]RYP27400.1 hypothetical protein DL766_006397 [Monosporascus sp. MC13-8B]